VIVYKLKSLNGHFMMNAHGCKRRNFDKNKRIYAKMNKLRKMWWHFKTRWDE